MTNDKSTKIISIVEQIGDRLDPSARLDVLDWVGHREWQLAVDVLVDKLIENSARLQPVEWDALSEVLVEVERQPERYRPFLCP